MPAASPHARSHGLRTALTVLATFGTAAIGLASPAFAQSASAATPGSADTLATAPAATSAARPVVSTRVLTSAHVANYGGTATVAVTVRVHEQMLRDATVYAYRLTSAGPRYAGAIGTGTSGIAHITVRPSVTDTYQLVYRGTATTAPSSTKVVAHQRTFGQSLLAAAAREIGSPYQWGASGPTRFDCSGLTRYVAHEFGRSLSHTAAGQYAQVHHVSRSSMQIGDLVFFYGGGGIYHVGFYAGHGRILAATHTGDFVREESIYTSHYLVGRLAP